jgi:signal transduction histidine kinase
MFRSATFRLTLWYLTIIMVISVLFSVVLYTTSTRELRTSLRRQALMYQTLPWYRNNVPTNEDYVNQLPGQQLAQAEGRLKLNLVLLNLGILAAAGGAGYFLALRTLRPIETALEAQSRFTADASHELRTPLTAMRAEIEVALRNGKLSQAEAHELLSSNLEEINKLEALSGGLLKLAQQNGGADTPKTRCSAEDVVKAAQARLEKTIQQRNMTVKTELAEVDVFGDRESLVDLVAILLDNAIKYSQPGTTITLSSGLRGRQGFIAVQDEGQGIKTGDIPHIFDRFYRADDSRTKDEAGGYGLGLSIARQIVESHHGSIEIQSVVGQGTTFRVFLPLPSQSA